jgi:hypothetical protein
VENLLWNRLWTCRKTDYEIMNDKCLTYGKVTSFMLITVLKDLRCRLSSTAETFFLHLYCPVYAETLLQIDFSSKESYQIPNDLDLCEPIYKLFYCQKYLLLSYLKGRGSFRHNMPASGAEEYTKIMLPLSLCSISGLEFTSRFTLLHDPK